jgi:Sigma-70 region 2
VSEAEDIVQEAFLRFHGATRVESPKAWLSHRIPYGKAVAHQIHHTPQAPSYLLILVTRS